MAERRALERLLRQRNGASSSGTVSSSALAIVPAEPVANALRIRDNDRELGGQVAAPRAKKRTGTYTCQGCARHLEDGVSFIDPGAQFKWARPDGGGAWCQDCFRCWRTKYKDEMPQEELGPWIKDSVKNRLELQLSLAALISFDSSQAREDGRAPAVSRKQLQERVETFRMMSLI